MWGKQTRQRGEQLQKGELVNMTETMLLSYQIHRDGKSLWLGFGEQKEKPELAYLWERMSFSLHGYFLSFCLTTL